MNQRKYVPISLLLVVALLLLGCRSNPAIRKQRYFDSGKRFSSDGKYREATIQFLNALKVDEDFADAHFELAHAYEHLGQFTAASDELERTIDGQPGNLSARIDLGNIMLAGGSINNAQDQANIVLTAQPDNAAAHALLSAIASRQGQSQPALAEIRRAIALAPDRVAYHENLALLLASDPASAASAEVEFKEAVQCEPDSLNARLLLASFYAHNNRLGEAEREAWKAVSLDPKSLTARADVAQIILKQGDWARAEQVLRQTSTDLSDTPQGAAILADYYANSQQFEKARAEYATQIARHPKNMTLQKGYARVLIQMHDYATSRPLVAGMLKNTPRDPEVTALNGVLLLIDGNTSEASSALHDSARLLPQDAFTQYWLGKAALSKGEINVAETNFRQAAALNPNWLDPLQELARIAGQRGDAASLEDAAKHAISSLPGLPDGYVWRAIVNTDRGSLSQAEADIKSALKVAPQSWQAYLHYGKLRMLQKRYSESTAMLEQALEYNPNSVLALRLLTDIDLEENRPEQALARVQAQIQKSPRNSSFYDMLAQLQLQSRKLDQAASTAERAIQLNTADGEAVSLLAQISVGRGMTAQAVDAWQQWSNAHPNDAGALAVLGTLEESRGNIDKAEAFYKKSLQIQPQQPIAANNLAYRMLENSDTIDSALNLAETARQGMPDSPTTADTLAWAYYHKGTYKFARDLLEDAISVDPARASMHYHLGMVYMRLKDRHNATVHLTKAITLARDPETAREAKNALQKLNRTNAGTVSNPAEYGLPIAPSQRRSLTQDWFAEVSRLQK